MRIRNISAIALLVAVLVIPDQARAQAHEHRSPYAGDETREIKALSAELLPILTDEQRMHYVRLRGYAAEG
ncbi:MAG: hypothetical protein E4H28_03610 [Gemmatimonadales bacterium]|nr:MAG: hypothetical protein E4H28_03610 [Gemmatimonadales bacterium]